MELHTEKRLTELDVFRGLAALSVVLFHYTTRFGEMFGYPNHPPAIQFSYGHYGVEFFFMISGFVIFLTLNRTKRYQDFVVSRFSRLFPVYWVAVIVSFSVISLLGLPGQQRSLSELIANFSMIQGFFHINDVDGVYWTLRYELLFYCIMLCIFLSGKISYIEQICAGWLALQLGAYGIEHFAGYFPWKIKQFLLLEYSHLFVAGCIFNRVFVNGFTPRRIALLIAALATEYVIYGISGGITVTIFFTLFTLFCLNKLGFLRIRPLIYLGTISYSLYLTHQNISYAIFLKLYALHVPQPLVFLIAFVVAVAIAHLLTFYVERPAMQYIRRLYRGHKDNRQPA